VLLTWFSDANFVRDVHVRKSTIRVIFFQRTTQSPGNRTKQRMVAQSSYESEYITAVNVTCQALWLARVLAEVQGSAPSTSLLRADNKYVNALIKISVLHEQRKHVEVKYHLVQESTKNDMIRLT
jgi:hypothetical protein